MDAAAACISVPFWCVTTVLTSATLLCEWKHYQTVFEVRFAENIRLKLDAVWNSWTSFSLLGAGLKYFFFNPAESLSCSAFKCVWFGSTEPACDSEADSFPLGTTPKMLRSCDSVLALSPGPGHKTASPLCWYWGASPQAASPRDTAPAKGTAAFAHSGKDFAKHSSAFISLCSF